MLKDIEMETLEEIRILSGLPMEQVRAVFRAFVIYSAMNYSEKEKLHLPYVGNLYVKYLGDEVTDEGREAKVTGFFSPTEVFKKIVGQIEDSRNGEDNFSNNLLIQMLKKDIFIALKGIM